MVQVPAHSFLLDDAEVEVQAELESFWAAEYCVPSWEDLLQPGLQILQTVHIFETSSHPTKGSKLIGQNMEGPCVCLFTFSESLCVALLFAVLKFTGL